MSAGYITDKEFGRVYVDVNARTRRYVMRVKDDGLHITVAPGTTVYAIRQTLDTHRKALRDLLAKAAARSQYIDFRFSIHTELLRLCIRPSTTDTNTVWREQGQSILSLRTDTPFDRMQDNLREAIIHELRLHAQDQLPERIHALACQHGFRYGRVTIRRTQTRWGSCSHDDNISLSLYLMTLPAHLVDYVLLHELCHTQHKDHSPAFWTLMDQVTNGQAKALRKELAGHSPRL